jgi:hypothetical protein
MPFFADSPGAGTGVTVTPHSDTSVARTDNPNAARCTAGNAGTGRLGRICADVVVHTDDSAVSAMRYPVNALEDLAFPSHGWCVGGGCRLRNYQIIRICRHDILLSILKVKWRTLPPALIATAWVSFAAPAQGSTLPLSSKDAGRWEVRWERSSI